MSKIDKLSTAFAVVHTQQEVAKLEEKLLGLLEEVQTMKGDRGDRGPQGARGEKGEKGDKGVKGEKGDQGVKGDKGDPGLRGEKGETGETGPQGERGADGQRGATGERGEKGEVGEQGIQGERGLKGDTGKTGAKGDTGKTGERGKDGAQGVAGPKGDVGLQGVQGIPGERGERGERGADGVDGAPGPVGEKGEKGEPGEAAKDYREEFEAALEQFNTRLTENVQKTDKNIQSQIDRINRSLSTLGGGGSYKLVDNADVDKAAIKSVVENAILIYDPAMKKFKAESFVNVLDRLKAELEIQYNRLIDTEGQYIYIGEALPGTATSAASWRIKRVDQQAGDDFEIVWADGTAEFTKIWDDRLSLTY